MNKLLRSSVAALVAAAGLMAVLSMPAGASAKKKTITCYALKNNVVKTKKVKAAHPACPKGWSKTKPKPKVGNLQGTNKPGDIDLNVPSNVSLSINGSSFDAPEVEATTSGSTAYSAGGKVSFSSYPAAGSGAGRTGITNGSLDIGFSDTPISAAAGTLSSGVTESDYAQVPYILGGAIVGYNLAGISNLKLTAQEVAEIYDGAITQWSNSLIVNTNGGASSTVGKALSNLTSNDTIKVIYRSASSGTTFAFTDYLHKAGGDGNAPSGNPMEGSSGVWHAPNILGAVNNAALATDINANPGSIGYIEYSYLLIPGNAKIQSAQLQDKNGQWLNPTLQEVANAATAAGTSVTPDNFSIVEEPGNDVWPLATYSWAIVPKAQTNEAKGEAIVKYLDWETHYAQKADAANVGYVPLPAAVAAYARAQLETITYNGTTLLTQKS